jgi:hypothetical protein
MGSNNTLGYDKPWRRDWLFWTLLLLSLVGSLIGYLWFDTPLWQALAQLGGGVFIGGLVFGGLREVVRGYREPRAAQTRTD